jgi:cell wall-associated NlpC family hydrolase
MTTKIERRSPKALRLAIATLLVVPAVVASMNPSAASPSKADVEAAKQKVAQLQDQFSALSENYNEALYQVQQAQQHLAEAKAMRDAAQKQAEEARSRLTARAVQTYTDMGSQYEALLSSDSLTQFSDRLEFLGALTQSDSTLASEADSATQRAAWATQEYDRAVADAQAKANAAQQERQKAEQALQDMEALAADLDQQYQQALAAQQQALAQQQQATAPSQPPTDSGTSGGGGFVPPPNASAAAIAVQAAYSALGAPYVFGAAGPSSFDCSGLTSWAWAQAGVYLPHSASAQWNSLPEVPLSQVQPGDIIYYANFGAHVAIYVGGGNIIHARHPGPGGEVQVSSMYGYDHPYGAVRPG